MADSLQIVIPDPPIEKTPTSWLVRRALQALNSVGEGSEREYSHAVELLRERADASSTLQELFRSSATHDVGLRWGALYIAGDIGDARTAEYLLRAATEPLPKQDDDKACEGPQDMELMIRTMAVESLEKVARRNPDNAEILLKLIAAKPERPVLIEAVKAARNLGLADRAADLLADNDRWILNIKIAPVREIAAEPERGNDSALGYMPPAHKRKGSASPVAACCSPREE